MAQVVNATRKTYEYIRKNYNIAKEKGRTGFSIWGNYMSLTKAETIMEMIEMSLDLPKGYVASTKSIGTHKAIGMWNEKPIPKEKLIPFDYIHGWDRDYFNKQREYLRATREIKALFTGATV